MVTFAKANLGMIIIYCHIYRQTTTFSTVCVCVSVYVAHARKRVDTQKNIYSSLLSVAIPSHPMCMLIERLHSQPAKGHRSNDVSVLKYIILGIQMRRVADGLTIALGGPRYLTCNCIL